MPAIHSYGCLLYLAPPGESSIFSVQKSDGGCLSGDTAVETWKQRGRLLCRRAHGLMAKQTGRLSFTPCPAFIA